MNDDANQPLNEPSNEPAGADSVPDSMPEAVPEILPAPAASRDHDGTDVPPPLAISGKGPMDQNTPDVATGSTPLTRRGD